MAFLVLRDATPANNSVPCPNRKAAGAHQNPGARAAGAWRAGAEPPKARKKTGREVQQASPRPLSVRGSVFSLYGTTKMAGFLSETPLLGRTPHPFSLAQSLAVDRSSPSLKFDLSEQTTSRASSIRTHGTQYLTTAHQISHGTWRLLSRFISIFFCLQPATASWLSFHALLFSCGNAYLLSTDSLCSHRVITVRHVALDGIPSASEETIRAGPRKRKNNSG